MGTNKVIKTGINLIVTILLIVLVPWIDILSSVSRSLISTVPSNSYQPLMIVAIITCTIVMAAYLFRNDSNDLSSALSDFFSAILEALSPIIQFINSLLGRYD